MMRSWSKYRCLKSKINLHFHNRQHDKALEDRNELEMQCIGFNEIKKERNERIKMLQDRVTAYELQNDHNEKKAIEFETKYITILELYESSKKEYNDACSRIEDVNQSKTNFELLCEHRLTKIKDLEREVNMKEDKILEFRNRFDLATQKLLEKDTKLREIQLERDKIESQFQKFKQSMVSDSKRSQDDSPTTSKEKQASKKNEWMKKREREEKSFVDANDYILVCK